MPSIQKDRLLKQKNILYRLKDSIDTDPNEAALTMLNTSLAVMAKIYPAQLSVDDKAKIKDNYPNATEELMAERAMSKDGVLLTAQAGLRYVQIALDYTPTTHSKTDMENDVLLQNEITDLRSKCADLFVSGLGSGISAFGVATIMALMATECASARGVGALPLVRSLVDLSLTTVEQAPYP